MARQKLRDLGMDTMERLYYERKDARQKAYAARKKKNIKRGVSAKKKQMGQIPQTVDMAVVKAC